jgi:NAD(P)-dependent dehydrogenase (short-subunit alcohol dehydrogenase family)
LVRFRDEEISMSDRTALVVGGTSGIGLATARRLHGLGATVHIAGRGKERIDDVAASDPGLIGHQADGASAAEIGALAEAIGAIDWLIVTLSGSSQAGLLRSGRRGAANAADRHGR